MDNTYRDIFQLIGAGMITGLIMYVKQHMSEKKLNSSFMKSIKDFREERKAEFGDFRDDFDEFKTENKKTQDRIISGVISIRKNLSLRIDELESRLHRVEKALNIEHKKDGKK